MILTGLGDEISPQLKEQLKVMRGEGIKYLEIRGVWGKNILDLSFPELERVRRELEEEGFKISAIGSPIGKIKITDDFEEHLKKFQKALDIAKALHASYIRIFSYYIPTQEKPDKFREEVIRRMEKKLRLAEKEKIILLHENERGIYGDLPERCRDILQYFNSPNLRANFDPANFVFEGVKPYSQAYPILKDFIAYVHIKDAKRSPQGIVCVPAGEGEGEIPQILKDLHQNGYNGFLSLEPHLAQAGRLSGFSGPEGFSIAARALKKILDQLKISYE